MAISLTWWAVQLSLWLFVMLVYTTLKVSDKIDVKNKLLSDGMGRAIVKYFDRIAVHGTGINLHRKNRSNNRDPFNVSICFHSFVIDSPPISIVKCVMWTSDWDISCSLYSAFLAQKKTSQISTNVFVCSSVSCDLLFGGCDQLRKIERCHSEAPIGNSESKCGLHGGADRKLVKQITNTSTASAQTINRAHFPLEYCQLQ